ncbi:MAG: peptidylprolyl isomerase [Pseudomonadota bacterium]
MGRLVVIFSVKEFLYSIVLAVLFLGPVANQAAAQFTEQVQRAVAIVNEDVISDYDVSRRLTLVLASTGTELSEAELQQLRQQILTTLVDEKLQMQAAQENEIEVTSDIVERAFSSVAGNFNQEPSQFESYLKNSGTSRRALEEQIRAEIAWSQVIQRRLEPQISIGDEEIEEAIERLEASKGQFEYNVAEIFLNATPQNEVDVQFTAQQIVERVRQGGRFDAFARQFSEAPTAAVGGDLGWVMGDQLSRTIRDLVPNMQIGQMTNPIKAPSGYYIIVLKDRRRILSVDPLDTQYELASLAWPLAENPIMADLDRAQRLAEGASRAGGSCSDIDTLKARFEAAEGNNLGSLRLRDLPPALQSALRPMEAGQTTEAIRFPGGYRVFIVCNLEEPVVQTPTPAAIENQLNQRRLSMMARRYLRDLRRDAIVEYK